MYMIVCTTQYNDLRNKKQLCRAQGTQLSHSNAQRSIVGVPLNRLYDAFLLSKF